MKIDLDAQRIWVNMYREKAGNSPLIDAIDLDGQALIEAKRMAENHIGDARHPQEVIEFA